MGHDQSRQKGAATVETALVSIFLLILVTGIIDLGRAVFNNISIQEAAQEGAFFGAFEEDVTVAEIETKSAASTSAPDLTVDNVAVECVPVTKTKRDGGELRVTVTYEMDLVTPFVGDWLGGSLTLEKTAESERFYPTCPGS